MHAIVPKLLLLLLLTTFTSSWKMSLWSLSSAEILNPSEKCAFCPRDTICILLIKKRNINLLFWPRTTGDVWKQVYLILNAVSALGIEVYVVALLAWLLLIAILGYFVHVLDNVIDTVYVCYAIDRDKGEVCKQEVHEVYVHLPISRNDRAHSHRTQSIVWYWMLSCRSCLLA